MNAFVSPVWLAKRLTAPNIAILDATLPPVGVTPRVDTRDVYLTRHIPGAVFFDIEEFSDHATPLPHMLPAAGEFARRMSALGIASGAAIVVYEQQGVFSAPRAWWMLRTLGAPEVHILDGGLTAWVEAGLPTESGTVLRPPAHFQAQFNREAVATFKDIQKIIAAKGQILDARSSARFLGTAPEPRPGLSSGHMPGATSIPFTELSEAGSLKSPDQLRELFRDKGIDLREPITTTCGSGVTAAVLALGLEIAGAKEVALYDGSWAEYAQHAEAVIEK